MEQERVRAVLELAYRALTEGMEDVPVDGRWRKCAKLRVEATRAIRRMLSEVGACEKS